MAVFLDTAVLSALAVGVGMLMFQLSRPSRFAAREGDEEAFYHRTKHELWSKGGW